VHNEIEQKLKQWWIVGRVTSTGDAQTGGDNTGSDRERLATGHG